MKLKRVFLALTLIAALCLSGCSGNGDKTAREGRELYNKGSYQEALEKFSGAESKGLKSFREAELYCLTGNCYYQLGDYDKCIEYQQKCLDADPEYFGGWVSMGVAYRKKGNNDKAMTCYEVALNYDPGDTTESGLLYLSLGALYIEKGKPITAIDYLEKARNIFTGNNESPTVYAYLSIAYKMALEPEKSEEAFRKAQELGYPDMDGIQAQLDKIN